MKKMLFMMFVITSLISFSSCSEDEVQANPLEGTLWSVEDEVFDRFTRYIEFIDDNSVKVWDTNGHGPFYGTYTIINNKVYFTKLIDKYWGWEYVEGTFTSRSLTVGHKYSDSSSTNLYYETYTKE